MRWLRPSDAISWAGLAGRVASSPADVAGYSRLTGLDEEGTHSQLLDHLRSLFDPKIAEHRGRVVKSTGDGLLAEFSGALGKAKECCSPRTLAPSQDFTISVTPQSIAPDLQ
jgi:class 3 adenylate cyclase